MVAARNAWPSSGGHAPARPLGYLLAALPGLSALHTIGGFAHGVIDPGRTVVTAAGQVVLLDAAFGAIVERLRLSRRRLWADFGIAAARGAMLLLAPFKSPRAISAFTTSSRASSRRGSSAAACCARSRATSARPRASSIRASCSRVSLPRPSMFSDSVSACAASSMS